MRDESIRILYEDDALFVISKPPGIIVNNSETTHGLETIQDWITKRVDLSKKYKDLAEDDFVKRNGIVHRLDKETSGIMLIAKTPESFQILQEQFKDRTVKKTYKALCHGVLIPKTGEIRLPVGRLPWNRKQFGIVAGGRPSVTLYETDRVYICRDEKLSLLTLYPQTGRTHQIRVHLKYLNHPIFSDYLYAGRKTARNDRKLLQRVFLHAYSIEFVHPLTHQQVFFEAELSSDLKLFLQSLQEASV